MDKALRVFVYTSDETPKVISVSRSEMTKTTGGDRSMHPETLASLEAGTEQY